MVQEALGGRSEALEALLQRLARLPGMVRAKHRRMGSPLDAHEFADAMQEALAAIWSKLAAFEGRAAFDTWAYRFAANELLRAVDHKHRRQSMVAGVDALRACDVDAQVEAAVDPAIMYACLAELERECAEVIHQRFFERRTFAQIALENNVPLGTAKTHFYRGMKRLRELLLRRLPSASAAERSVHGARERSMT